VAFGLREIPRPEPHPFPLHDRDASFPYTSSV